MAYEDPYVVLGIQKGASKKEIQKAFRELALKHHPDKDPSLEAAQRFQSISRAATSIMKEGSHSPSSAAAAARQRWQHHNQSAGQQWVRSARYSYNISTNADERRENPTPAQQRINELLQEKRIQKQFDER